MSETKVKDEPEDITENDPSEPPSFAAALGLQRVGTKLPPKPVSSQPIQVLNARGMPARIRKKNKLFFDDDIVNDKPMRTSPIKKSLSAKTTPVKPLLRSTKTPVTRKRGVTTSPQKINFKINKETCKDLGKRKHEATDSDEYYGGSDNEIDEKHKETDKKKEEIQLVDRKVCQKIGYKLRNLLKLPKAHKFVSYEWFYSSIDKPLFDGETDFQICLRESFPMLKTRMLTRAEWNKIRRMMGKPRRCSQAFFDEERNELERKRQKVRILQTRKYCDVSFVKDLPKEIPLPLPVGTKVTARLRRPQDGLFTGVVDALDLTNNTYRIAFDRSGLGPQSIPDFEVLCNEPIEFLPLLSLTQKFRPKSDVSLYVASSLKKPGVPLSASKGDPFLVASNQNKNAANKLCKLPKEQIGGFPLKLLELIIRSRKTLQSKSAKLMRLKEMNNEAEMYKSYGEEFPDDFQRKYASIVIGMEKLNRDLQDNLNQIQIHCKQIVRDSQQAALLSPSYMREKCRQMGEDSFNKNNKNTITNNRMKTLISNLAMIMWVVSNLSSNDDNMQILHVIEACIEDVKNKLDVENIETFQKLVQIHLHHIQLELRQSIASPNSNKVTDN